MKKSFNLFALVVSIFLAACQPTLPQMPTRVPLAFVPTPSPYPSPTFDLEQVPSTFTPPPEEIAESGFSMNKREEAGPAVVPTSTPVIPTRTQVPALPTPTRFRFTTPTPEGPIPTETPPVIKPIDQYRPNEIIPYQAFPTPPNDNGWGMHWVPTVSQEPAVVDRFVAEMVRMHIKWVVFLNDGTNIGANDYLVDKLVANDIMPVMRLYRSGVLPYDGNVGALVRHYRARGVYYYQLYNEPNVNIENSQGFSNPNQYALNWASAAREVIANGGLPGIGALSPGGEYSHYDFLDRTLGAIIYNGDANLLNHTWLSVHNYHGTRAFDDPGGFLLFRSYNDIVRSRIGRSLPMIGTEGGSYSNNKATEAALIRWQYEYMRDAEPYYLVFSYWLIANQEGGSWDPAWEWQSLFQPGYVHPVVYDFFYQQNQ